jgi:HD-GYP domain-containing protein (c-di-GMP phosphodiesterase class II)
VIRLNTTSLANLVGTILEHDVVDDYGAIVIPRNKLVTDEDVAKAGRHPISGLIRTRRNEYNALITEAVGELSEIFETVRLKNRIPLLEVQRSIVPHVSFIVEQPNVSQLLHDLRTQDNYTVCHSFAVSILATMIGKWMNLEPRTVTELTTAATLHDVGKMKIPLTILNKPGKLSPEEYAIVQKHTIYGYELIQNTVGTSHHQALAALQHHERVDGGGYPFKVIGEKMCLFAKIIGVADVFHAMSSKRVYHDSMPLYQVLEELSSGMFGKFDVQILLLFLTKMMSALVGSSVILSDGREGEIVLIHAADPTHPLVRSGEDFIDLSQNSSIRLQQMTMK